MLDSKPVLCEPKTRMLVTELHTKSSFSVTKPQSWTMNQLRTSTKSHEFIRNGKKIEKSYKRRKKVKRKSILVFLKNISIIELLMLYLHTSTQLTCLNTLTKHKIFVSHNLLAYFNIGKKRRKIMCVVRK